LLFLLFVFYYWVGRIRFIIFTKMKTMDATEIWLVKSSWINLRGINPRLIGEIFYTKLFTDHPGLRRMFPRQMDDQYKKLIDMISIMVTRLDHIDELTDDIAEMARRHVRYGVRPAHYKWVGDAFLWTLEKGLGKDWTPETKNAWIACYQMVADTMMNAGQRVD
jgi:hemoglobin-like flavoprotein